MVRPFVQGDSRERRYGLRFAGVLVLGHVLTAGFVVVALQLVGTLAFAWIPFEGRVWAVAHASGRGRQTPR